MMSDDFDAAIGAALEAEINAKTADRETADRETTERKGDAGQPKGEPSEAGAPDAPGSSDRTSSHEGSSEVASPGGEAPSSSDPTDQAVAVEIRAEADGAALSAVVPAPVEVAAPYEAAETARRVSYERRGNLGLIALERPDALNAIDLDMVRAIQAYAAEAEADDAVLSLAIRAPEGRAFCAGGDIRRLWEWGRGGKRELFAFYREEYRLNHYLATMRTPFVALMHGIVMGGGAGLACHARHRVVAEDVRFAMPEVGIGFVPDVGATHLLARAPGLAGRYMALTGERVSGADMLWAGLADAHVSRGDHENVLDRLSEGEPAEEAVDAFAADGGESALANLDEAIDGAFAGDVSEILHRLDGFEGEHGEWARATAATIRRQCPFSVLATQGLMDRAEGASLADCLVNEFRAATRAVQRQDFYEGVRAAVIDKDRKPRWRPGALEDVSRDEIDALFAPSPMRDVAFD